jgi:Rieske Fe-S protein
MDRKQFISTCGMACVAGMGALTVLLESCAGSRTVTGTLSGDHLEIPLEEFQVIKKKVQGYRSYVIVQHEKLQYPVCVYRNSDTSYTALLMKCTHQNNELTAYGDKLHCAAHGSEFNKQGKATHGPAEAPLRTFPVTVAGNLVKISLKAT